MKQHPEEVKLPSKTKETREQPQKTKVRATDNAAGFGKPASNQVEREEIKEQNKTMPKLFSVTFSAERATEGKHLQFGDNGRTVTNKGSFHNEICFMSKESMPKIGKSSMRFKVFVPENGWGNLSLKGMSKDLYDWEENCTLISPIGVYLDGEELMPGEGFP